MNNFEFGEKMKRRTKSFAVQIVKFYKKLPKTDEARVLGRQVLRSGTSVAANYRAVCRAKSQADFISKMGMHCLILVDIQNDFLPGGALAVPDGDAVKIGRASCRERV